MVVKSRTNGWAGHAIDMEKLIIRNSILIGNHG
jgi:hypothetical protein